MTLQQIRHALLVAELQSFSAAARRAGVSQSTMSASVSSLEAELGRPLFLRTTRKVDLSAFGRTMLPRLLDVVSSVDTVERLAGAAARDERPMLRVGFSALLDGKRVAALCAPYRKAWPRVEVVYKECDADGLDQRLREEQVDVILGVGLKDEAGRARRALFEDVLRLLPAGGAGGTLPRSVELQDIAEQTFVLTAGACGLAPATEALFKREGVPLSAYPGRALSHATLQEWADLGIGAALLPSLRIGGDPERFPILTISGRPATIVYEAVWLRAAMVRRHQNAFLNSLPNAARALQRAGALRVAAPGW